MSVLRTIKHMSIFQGLKPIVGPSSSHTTAPFVASFLVYRLFEKGFLENDIIHHVEIHGRERGDLPYRGHRTFGAIVAGYRGIYLDDEDSLSRTILESAFGDPDKLRPRVYYHQLSHQETLEGAVFRLCFISKYGDTVLEAYSLGGGTVEPRFLEGVAKRYLRDVSALEALSSIVFDREFETRKGIPLWLYLSFGSLLGKLCSAASEYFNKDPDELLSLIDERQRLYASFSTIVRNSKSEKAKLHEYVLRLEEKLLGSDIVDKLLEKYIEIVLRTKTRCYDVLKMACERVRDIFYVSSMFVENIEDIMMELKNLATGLRSVRNTMFYAFITMLRVLSSRIILSAPTAGSAGIVPAVLCTLYDMLGQGRDAVEALKSALVIAGLVNVVAANRASTSGSLHGCQAEIGVALSMAAAAYAYILSDYDSDTAERAAVFALRTVLGLPCDPVLGFVEIPCVERNIILSEIAILSAKLALSGASPLMTLDNIIDTMKITGQLLPQTIKEQAYGPLSCVFLSEKTEKLINTLQTLEKEQTQNITDTIHKFKDILKVISTFLRQAEWN